MPTDSEIMETAEEAILNAHLNSHDEEEPEGFDPNEAIEPEDYPEEISEGPWGA